MALANGLYKSQDQQEQDLTDGPGWTIDDQKPTFLSGLGVTPLIRGIGQGAADGISLLTHGLHGLTQDLPLPNPVHLMTDPIKASLEIAGSKPVPSALEDASQAARDFSKTLVADPRTTGVAANLVQGFGKAATEFTVGSLAGGPSVGATLLGASEGYAHYNDLLDQGVDEATATKSGLLTAMTSGAGALLPMGMPAKWLAGLSTSTALAAQVGAGAAINTAFGAASRYGSAKILEDAGYHEMAEQQKPWDETNLLTDAITGMFFGAHAGWHGLKSLDAANVDPSIRDAAKVVQDRQAVVDRAPGVPVDMKSAAVHRQALDTALGDLMTDKPVDLSSVDTEGATFARRPVEEGSTEAAQIMRAAFEESGVLDDAAAFDRWLAGEKKPEPSKEVSTAPQVASIRMYHGGDITDEGAGRWYTQSLEDARGWADGGPVHYVDVPSEHPAHERLRGDAANGIAPDSRMELPADLDTRRKPLEETPQVHPGALADRPDLQIVNEHGEPLHAGDEQQRAIDEEAQGNKEAEPMFQAAVQCEARHA